MAKEKSQKGKRTKQEKKAYWIKCLLIAVVISVLGTTAMVLFLSENSVAQYPEPTSYFYIEDCSGVFTEETENYIFEQAVALQEATQAQIVVIAIPDTQSTSLENFSYNLANEWGIGDAELDNGVLLLFTTTEAHVRLEIGKGLEGCLTDAKSGRILDNWAVDEIEARDWNKAAINTFVATAKEVYAEYGIEAPDSLLAVDEVSEKVTGSTMADAEFSEEIVVENEQPMLTQIIVAFFVFWFFAIIPYILICINYYIQPSGRKKTHNADTDTWIYDETDNSSDSFSDFSGGGGSFGGGGASR